MRSPSLIIRPFQTPSLSLIQVRHASVSPLVIIPPYSPTAPLLTRPSVSRKTTFPQRKVFLLEKYQQIFTNSNQVVLLFSHKEFKASDWHKLRTGVLDVSKKAIKEGNVPKVMALRPGLIPPLIRTINTSNMTLGEKSPFMPVESLEPIFSKISDFGTELAVIYLQKFDGPLVSKIISLASKISLTPSAKATAKEAAADANKGKAAPSASKKKEERLPFLCSLMFSRAQTPKQTMEMTKLPSLEQLQGQIVGLIGMVGSELVGSIEGSGREVLRTLEGYEKGLEEGAGKKED